DMRRFKAVRRSPARRDIGALAIGAFWVPTKATSKSGFARLHLVGPQPAVALRHSLQFPVRDRRRPFLLASVLVFLLRIGREVEHVDAREIPVLRQVLFWR